MAEGGPSRKSVAPSSGLRLEVEVVRHGEAWAREALNDAMVERAARAAFLAAPPDRQGTYQVTFVLTDDAEMKELNRIWRGKHAPTNVLSFPAGDAAANEPGLLGDIVLAHETILEEAREANIALSDHVSHLVVHGLLHLLGFDHLTDAQAKRMEERERSALASIGIADPYAEEGVRSAEVSP